MKDDRKADGSNIAEHTCPECKRPYYYYMAPQPTQYRKIFGVPVLGIVIIIVLIIIFVFIPLFFLFIPIDLDSEEVRDDSFEVIIDNGGHYRHTVVNWYYEVELDFEIDSESGNNFDVYLMNTDQYENFYRYNDGNISAFASIESWEDQNNISDNVKIEEWREGEGPIYLVIDNRETSITDNDASPVGKITIDVKITTINDYNWD